MTRFGVALSGEQHGPDALIEKARRAEEAGLEFALVSDHFHPWLAEQDESSFVWTVLGGIARETDDLEVGTGVTCPTMRVHPAIVAQAAATTAAAFDGRFFLGVGTGERLNEHVIGEHWPEHAVRLEMLEEAVEIIRELWNGAQYSHHGEHYTVENARLYTLPDERPPLHVAAEGSTMADAAGRIGDGLVATEPDASTVEEFESGGDGDGDRPRYGQMTACYADSENEAERIAHEHWRNGALPGELGQELSTPKHFDQATRTIEPADVAESAAIGPEPEPYVEQIEEYVDAGFDHVYFHQVNPDAEGFFEFYQGEILPAVTR
jgi:G6PDH family F420-dependent oxidoreductase